MSFFVYDVAVIGGGPAGASCATACAKSGLTVLLLERSRFPREKVCGDCINPACWPVFARLGVHGRVASLAKAEIRTVEFVPIRGRSVNISLPVQTEGEIAVRRSELDHLLLQHAIENGAEVRQDTPLIRLDRDQDAREWEIETSTRQFRAKNLVAADGRNSTVARLLNLLRSANRDRVGLQTHIVLPTEVANRVVMRFLRAGYCGLADVGNGQANLCLVSRPADLAKVKDWATGHFGLPLEQTWRSIAPLSRAPVPPSHEGLLLVGDAARVVEPFTGEGIYYALATGEFAARHLVANDLPGYARAHRALYRGRLWVNHVARIACLHPEIASAFLQIARWAPGLLGLLTRKVTVPTAKRVDRPIRATNAAASG